MGKQIKICPKCGAPYVEVTKWGWDGDRNSEQQASCDCYVESDVSYAKKRKYTRKERDALKVVRDWKWDNWLLKLSGKRWGYLRWHDLRTETKRILKDLEKRK